MIRIAIVDDDRKFSSELEILIKKIIEKLNDHSMVKNYDNCYNLLDDIKQNKRFDVYFLDVEIPGINGLELAEKIREEDQGANIVFISAFPQYAISSYKIHAYYYILKEEYKTETSDILKEIWEKIIDNRAEYYIIQGVSYGKRMQMDDIIYLMREKKYVVFQCTDGKEYKERSSLGAVYEKLPHDRFVYIDKGCIINLKHVKDWEGDHIKLNNAVDFFASRRMIKCFKDALLTYWRIE